MVLTQFIPNIPAKITTWYLPPFCLVTADYIQKESSNYRETQPKIGCWRRHGIVVSETEIFEYMDKCHIMS